MDNRRKAPISITDNSSRRVVDVVRLHNGGSALVDHTTDNPVLQASVGITPRVLDISLNKYQEQAMRTRGEFGDKEKLIDFSALEIASECGEVVNIIYKHLYQKHPLDVEHLVEELGDMLWGIASMADAVGVPLSVVGASNIAKLQKRYSNGRFTKEDSIARVDHQAGQRSSEGES